jgi:hypothetical protein
MPTVHHESWASFQPALPSNRPQSINYFAEGSFWAGVRPSPLGINGASQHCQRGLLCTNVLPMGPTCQRWNIRPGQSHTLKASWSFQMRSGGPTFLLAVSVQDEVAALETGFHFPCVLGIVPLRSVHRLTNVVLAHRGCLLGTVHKPKQERLAPSGNPFLQPYIHEVILSPTSRSEVN